MTEIYHIQISVYIKAQTITGAKAGARMAKDAIETMVPSLDEVVIDNVEKEISNIPADLRSKTPKEICSDAEFLDAVGKCAKIKVPKTPDN